MGNDIRQSLERFGKKMQEWNEARDSNDTKKQVDSLAQAIDALEELYSITEGKKATRH